MLSTVLVEDDLYAQKVLQDAIAADGRFLLTAVLCDAFEAEKLCAAGNVDVLLTALRTRGNHSGLAAARRVKVVAPRTRVLLLTSFADPDVLRAARSVADGLWYKDGGAEGLTEAAARVANGARVFPIEPPHVWLGELSSEALSPRQIKILRCFAGGLTYEQTAAALGMTKRNVRWHLDTVTEKCGFENKHQLLLALLDSKLIMPALADGDLNDVL